MNDGTIDPPTGEERLAALEREIAAIKHADPLAKATAALGAGRLLSQQARAAEAAVRQAAAARQAAVERAAEEIERERRVHAPEIERHDSELAEIDAKIARATTALEKAERTLEKLCGERRSLAAHPPWTAPSPYPPGVPIMVGTDLAADDAEPEARRRRFRARTLL